MFQTFGVKNVKVLDGGLPKWEKEGRKVESDADIGTDDDYKVSINPENYRNYAQIAELEKEIADGKSDA
jgi:thiosulfate/3-mercaptopyruvate sulfurtransferase